MSFCLATAAERFSERLTDEERRAAGLDRLTAEQVAALDAFVQRERAAGEKKVEEQTRVAAEAAAKAKARVEVRDEEKKQREAEVRVLSRVVGKFTGWSGGTTFRLENGQVWRQTDSEMHYVPAVESAPVLIEKAYGGWRLYDPAGGWCRVVRVR